MLSDEEIIQKCYSGKIDKKKLMKLGGTVGFTDILYEAIRLAKEEERERLEELLSMLEGVIEFEEDDGIHKWGHGDVIEVIRRDFIKETNENGDRGSQHERNRRSGRLENPTMKEKTMKVNPEGTAPANTPKEFVKKIIDSGVDYDFDKCECGHSRMNHEKGIFEFSYANCDIKDCKCKKFRLIKKRGEKK